MNQISPKSEALDALQEVRASEVDAKKKIQDAREKKSAKIIQEAREEAERIKEKILDEARKKAEEKKLFIIQEAKKKAAEIKESCQKDSETLRKKTASLMPGAEKKTAKKIKEILKGRDI